MKRKSILLVLLCLLSVRTALAQVNMQVFYDFGSDRKYVTMTLEMFKADKWGNTYFFIDHDFNYKQHESNADNGVAPGGTYLEISRCLNF
jgi:steroid 5-alpha reductase family enzyme